MRFLLALAAFAAAAAPFVPQRSAPPPAEVVWPTQVDGRPLTRIAPTAFDRRLARDFPGRIARFSDGRSQVVLRHVGEATRQLHPVRDCFAAIGYRVVPVPMQRSPNGALSSCFEATRDGRTLRICERVVATDGSSMPDVSSWYWPALLGTSPGPWLAITIVTRIR
ncbi:hypothetical protein ACFSC3_00970 [Sphingomonas floccifaciens]|uniref:Uncharacterized protein n=1 Tax=Sphingomonas floccifaciens TaxID=1844115 RepID=A0ABW4N8E2_9SPHN